MKYFIYLFLICILLTKSNITNIMKISGETIRFISIFLYLFSYQIPMSFYFIIFIRIWQNSTFYKNVKKRLKSIPDKIFCSFAVFQSRVYQCKMCSLRWWSLEYIECIRYWGIKPTSDNVTLTEQIPVRTPKLSSVEIAQYLDVKI